MLAKKTIVLLFVMAAILIICPVLALCSGDNETESMEMTAITVWQIDSFEGGKGSRAQYLKARAGELFDGQRVYVNVISLSSEAARRNIQAGVLPDIISYGAGFYGLEGVVGGRDVSLCWCRGAYLYITLGGNGDFSDINGENVILSDGRDNLSGACALFEGLYGIESAPPQTAYLKFLEGDKKYLLGTQRDIARLSSKGVEYSAKVITSFNDLYQCVTILSRGENYTLCKKFCEYLIESSEKVSSLGLVSDKSKGDGIYSSIQSARYEYTIKTFVGKNFYQSITSAVKEGDINSLKYLLK